LRGTTGNLTSTANNLGVPNISTPTSQVWRFFQGLLEDRVVLEAQVRIGGAELSNVFGLQLQQLWVQPAASVETWSSGQLDNQDLGPTDGRSSGLRKEKVP